MADYVARLPAGEAVAALLPHLWYDPDWEYAAAAAIAMHPEHDEVLRALLLKAARSAEMPVDLSAIDGGGAIRGLLARVASESKEPDWSKELAQIIGQARIDLARLGVLRDLGEAAHWPTSTGPIREVLPELLAKQTDFWARERLANTLARLDPARRDEYLGEASRVRVAMRRLVEAVTRDSLGTEQVAIDPDLVNRIYRLAPVPRAAEATELGQSASDVDRVRQTLLKLHDPELDGLAAWWMAKSLPDIDPMDQDARLARQALLTRMGESPASEFSMFVAALTALGPTEEEKLRARQLVCERLVNQANFPAITGSSLVPLDPTVSDLSAWRSWTEPPTADLLVAVRRNSALEEWLELIPALAGLQT